MPKHRNAAKLAGIDTRLHYRAVPLRSGKTGEPETLDEATRSVEIVAATETPVPVFDYDRLEMVPEVLLMAGCEIPPNRQVPMLDTHLRMNTANVIGSVRDLEVRGTELIGRAHYSTAPEGEGPYLKMKEGHLTDYSAGYRYDKRDAVFVPEGKSAIIDGRSFTGPVKVVRKWKIKETSACPIGSDEMAKARAAEAPDFNPQEETDMNEKLRAFLESRGLAKDATEEEAWRFLETLNVRSEPQGAAPAGGDPPQVDEQVRTAVRAEQERIIDIRAIGARAGLDEAKINELVLKGSSVEDARKLAFDHVTATAAKPAGFRAEVVADERDKFRAAASDSLIVRAGMRYDQDKLAQGAMDLRGYSLRELARECLRMAGQSTGGDALQMVGRALTTSDFPTLLGNTANLALLAGWEGAEETWETWADGNGSVSDFKTQTLARAGEVDDLDEIGEEAEYKYGTLSEQSETFRLATYGKLNKISRQAIINDELGSITDAFARRGEAAARKIGDLVYAVLTANSAMGDGTALFHANHGNLGTQGAISVTTIGEAVTLMGLQKDIGGKRRLNIPARFFLGSKTTEVAAEIFFGSQMLDVASGSNQTNPFGGNRFVRVYDARLDDDSTTAYYLAGPKGRTVKVFFLNGNRMPYLETRDGWTVDGVEFKTRIDAGAKALSWKGLVKNVGA